MNESVNPKAWKWAAKKNLKLNSAQILGWLQIWSWLQIFSWRPLELTENIGMVANIKFAANIELASTWVVAVHFQCLPHAESRAAGLGGLTDHRRPPGSLHCQSSGILNLKSRYWRCNIGDHHSTTLNWTKLKENNQNPCTHTVDKCLIPSSFTV